jgi:hypothetical protein
VFAVLVDAKDEAAQRFYEHCGFTLLAGAYLWRLLREARNYARF